MAHAGVPQKLAPSTWQSSAGFFFSHLAYLPVLQNLCSDCAFASGCLWKHGLVALQKQSCCSAFKGRYVDVGIAYGAFSEPRIHGTFFVFLQAKLLFSDGKKVVPRLPHEQAVPKVIAVTVHRGLNDL